MPRVRLCPRSSLTWSLSRPLSGFDGALRVQAEVLGRGPGAFPQKHLAVLPELRGARAPSHRVGEGGQEPHPELHRYPRKSGKAAPALSMCPQPCVFVCVCVVIPQHGVDSSLSSNAEEVKVAVYYERLKILRQRQGLENTSRVRKGCSPTSVQPASSPPLTFRSSVLSRGAEARRRSLSRGLPSPRCSRPSRRWRPPPTCCTANCPSSKSPGSSTSRSTTPRATPTPAPAHLPPTWTT